MLISTAGFAQQGFSFVDNPAAKKIEVQYKGKLLTAYCYFDSTEKPVLFPVKSISGVTVTRGFPIAPRIDERTDHPHQVGVWFTYESVNGLDFWNNSYAIPKERKANYGSIKFIKLVSKSASGNKAELVTLSHWVSPVGKVLLEEVTKFSFQVKDNDFIIDRKCTLTATNEDVLFKDVKDGLLGMRVARALEMPSTQQDKFVDAQGNETVVAALHNEGVTGMYLNKEGTRGDSVWSTRSQWVALSGTTQGTQVSLVMIDHPKNVGYPTYWHARGYGLFAANPLGQNVFSNGKQTLSYSLKKGESTTFNYRIVVHEKSELTPEQINALASGFTK